MDVSIVHARLRRVCASLGYVGCIPLADLPTDIVKEGARHHASTGRSTLLHRSFYSISLLTLYWSIATMEHNDLLIEYKEPMATAGRHNELTPRPAWPGTLSMTCVPGHAQLRVRFNATVRAHPQRLRTHSISHRQSHSISHRVVRGLCMGEAGVPDGRTPGALARGSSRTPTPAK